MKNKRLLSQTLIYLLLVIFIIETIIFCTVYLALYKSSKTTFGNINQEVLRIKIYGASSEGETNTVSGTFSIIDSNRNEIAVIERSWTGLYLSVDFVQIKINNQYHVFPSMIHGKERIFDVKRNKYKGTDLSRYYNENGQCLLLGYGSSLKERKALKVISKYALGKYPVIRLFNKPTVVSIDLSGCRTGLYYSIQTTENDDLIVQEL